VRLTLQLIFEKIEKHLKPVVPVDIEATGPQSVKSTFSSLASFLDHALAAKVLTESDESLDLAKIARRRPCHRDLPRASSALEYRGQSIAGLLHALRAISGTGLSSTCDASVRFASGCVTDDLLSKCPIEPRGSP
jgi:hypothetical protein